MEVTKIVSLVVASASLIIIGLGVILVWSGKFEGVITVDQYRFFRALVSVFAASFAILSIIRLAVIAHPGCSRPMLDGGAASTLRRSSRMERRLALAVLTTERNAA
jgi:hypothetical protein